MATSDFRKRIELFLAEYDEPEMTTPAGDTELAEKFIAGLAEEEVVDLATQAAWSTIWAVRRDRQRAAEARAVRSRPTAEQSRATAAARAAEQSEDQRWSTVFDDPTTTEYPHNAGERAAFRRWLGDRFPGWYERAHAGWEAVATTGGGRSWHDVEMFEDDWHPSGVMAAGRQRTMLRVSELIHEVAAQVRLDVTEELLHTEFALGGGQRVTWGEASAEQHRQRIELLSKNAAANVEAAARHEKAIEMLCGGRVANLRELAA